MLQRKGQKPCQPGSFRSFLNFFVMVVNRTREGANVEVGERERVFFFFCFFFPLRKKNQEKMLNFFSQGGIWHRGLCQQRGKERKREEKRSEVTECIVNSWHEV